MIAALKRIENKFFPTVGKIVTHQLVDGDMEKSSVFSLAIRSLAFICKPWQFIQISNLQ